MLLILIEEEDDDDDDALRWEVETRTNAHMDGT